MIPYNYHQSTSFHRQQPQPQHLFKEHALQYTLALTLVKSAASKSCLQSLAFAFKQIQFHILRMNRCSEVFKLHQRIKDCGDSISEIRQHSIHKQKSMELLRNIKSSLDKRKFVHSQSGRPTYNGLTKQKHKIIDEITEKLQVKNRVPKMASQKPSTTNVLNKRVAKLQNFMLQIKKEREFNEKPAVILERKGINRINYHMLSQKLAEERKKSEEVNKHKEIFFSIEQIREELKNMQKIQEKFVKNPEKNPESSMDVSKASGVSGVSMQSSLKDRVIIESAKMKTSQQFVPPIPMMRPFPSAQPSIPPQSFQFSPRPHIRFVTGSQNQPRRVTFSLVQPH